MNKHKRALGLIAFSAAAVAALSTLAAVHAGTSSKTRTVATPSAPPTASGLSPSRKLQLAVPRAVTQTRFSRFIVRYRDGASRSTSSALASFRANAERAGIGRVGVSGGTSAAPMARHVRKMGIGADVIQLSQQIDAVQAEVLLSQLRSDPAVLSAEIDQLLQPTDFIPDDTRFGDLQWHYRNVSGVVAEGAPPNSAGGINLPKAWAVPISREGTSVPTPNGEGVVVAVLDTGYVDHADLAANVVPGYDFISAYGQSAEEPDIADDGDGRDADAHDPGDWVDATMTWCPNKQQSNSSWHGTHVAGTIAAVTNNANGVAGVAFNARVMPVRVLGHCGGFTSDIADAITWASGGSVPGVPDNPNPADVINMSLGGSGSCPANSAQQVAINGAISRGTTVVVAAGNTNSDAGNHTPASCSGVITVGSTGVDASKSFFSNHGLTVTLSAPGGGAASSGNALNESNVIWSTGNRGTTRPIAGADGGDVLLGMVGTSMAAPHVAGVVALMQSTAVSAGQSPLTPALVRQVLSRTARSFPSAVSPPVPMGVGIVDANAAVLMSRAQVELDPAIPLTNRIARQITTISKNPLYNTAAGASNLFVLGNVPAGKLSLNVRTYGGTNASDVALYVRRGAPPTLTDFDFKSDKSGTSETVLLTRPAAGDYYVLVVNTKASSDVFVLAAF